MPPLLREGLARYLRSASVPALQSLRLRRLGDLSDLRRELQAVLEECQQAQVELEICELVLEHRLGRVGFAHVDELLGSALPSVLPLVRLPGGSGAKPPKKRRRA
jgi:hypothetical protein